MKMKKLNETTIRIEKDISISEDWYRGRVEHKEDIHEFWLVYSHGQYCEDDYPYRVEWMRKQVSREVKSMENNIIEEFELRKDGER
jgi:hypothetical protein